jgi:5-methylthioadenosine/S-adenosylhomocysteine deaminase
MDKQALLLSGATILTMDDRDRWYEDGAILVKNGRIEAIGSAREIEHRLPADCERIELPDRWILPGFVNSHVHTAQQLARGLADDVDLLTWLRDRIWPYESHLTEEDSYISALLTGIELIRSGVTTFCEAGGQHVDAIGCAAEILGQRAMLCRSTMDIPSGLPASWDTTKSECLDQQVEHFWRWQNEAQGRIRVCLGLRTIFNCSDDLILGTRDLAAELGIGINMHVAEIPSENDFCFQRSGKTTVEHLADLKILGPDFLAVHCVWLTPKEVDLFAQFQVKVSHNPAAAMRVLGWPRITEMQHQNICISLGTDGAPCNNRMTLIDEMWLATLLQKARTQNPAALPVESVLGMVTRDGARALGWENEIGSLAEQKQADLIVIDPNTATMLPLHDSIANLVNALREHNVESVMVAGNWVMRDRQILTVNESEVFAEAKQRAPRIRERAGIVLPERFNKVRRPGQ